MGSTLREFVAEDLWLLIGVVTFAVAGLVAISGFGTLSSAIAVVGWFLLAPIFMFWGEEIATAAFDENEPETAAGEPASDRNAVDELKRRYAAGDIDEAEFERRLDRLLAVNDALEGVFTDSAERAGASVGNDGSVPHPETAPDGADERDPAFER